MAITINTTQATIAAIIAEIKSLRGDYESASRRIDAMTSRLLALSNEDLPPSGTFSDRRTWRR